jgi:hypothetical protein
LYRRYPEGAFDFDKGVFRAIQRVYPAAVSAPQDKTGLFGRTIYPQRKKYRNGKAETEQDKVEYAKARFQRFHGRGLKTEV